MRLYAHFHYILFFTSLTVKPIYSLDKYVDLDTLGFLEKSLGWDLAISDQTAEKNLAATIGPRGFAWIISINKIFRLMIMLLALIILWGCKGWIWLLVVRLVWCMRPAVMFAVLVLWSTIFSRSRRALWILKWPILTNSPKLWNHKCLVRPITQVWT